MAGGDTFKVSRVAYNYDMLKIFLTGITGCVLYALCFAQTSDDRGYIVKVGDEAPAFEFELTDGTKVKSKKLKGSVIMLQFTASWCGVCRKEMPFIESEIWQVHKDQGLKLFGVDRDEPLEKAKALAEATGITYPLALDPGAEVFRLFAHEKAGVTRNVIIDQSGKIVFLTRLFERAEFDEMKEVIAELMAKEK
jgi:peroxiredoxin